MFRWLIDWYCLFGWDWLYSMSVWQYDFMHTSSTACQHLGSSSRISPKVRFPFFFSFFLNIRPSIHSFVVRRACCEIPVWLLHSGVTWHPFRYLVTGLALSRVPKVQKIKTQAEEKRTDRTAEHTAIPALTYGWFPKQRFALWSSLSMAFKMILAPCCLWETQNVVCSCWSGGRWWTWEVECCVLSREKSTLCPRSDVCWN